MFTGQICNEYVYKTKSRQRQSRRSTHYAHVRLIKSTIELWLAQRVATPRSAIVLALATGSSTLPTAAAAAAVPLAGGPLVVAGGPLILRISPATAVTRLPCEDQNNRNRTATILDTQRWILTMMEMEKVLTDLGLKLQV